MSSKTSLTQLLLLVVTALAMVSCNREQPPPEQPPPAKTAKLPAPARSIFDPYLKIADSLSSDSMKGVPEEAAAMADEIRKQPDFPRAAAAQADALAKTTTLADARKAFQPLSQSMIQYLKQQNLSSAYVRVYCPMVKASWLQTDAKIRNPYYGTSMLECGEVQK